MASHLTTLGHGTAGQDDLAGLLRAARIARLVDIRRYPGSRAHPHVGRDALARWLPTVGVTYRWDERLGGRRRLPPNSPDTWWQVASFRAYAHHMRGPEFRSAIDDLLADLAAEPTAVMCSESLWWRCHRRLVADFVTLVEGTPVCHLDHSGRLRAHRSAPGARRTDDVLVYDATEN